MLPQRSPSISHSDKKENDTKDDILPYKAI